MLRSISKTCYAAAYSATRTARATVRMPFIVCYHRVVESFDHSARTAIPSMLISTAMLERHIDWLAKRFKIVSLDEIGMHLESRDPHLKPLAAITFDDGYSDVYHHAFPLLKRKGLPASVFVVTDLIGTGQAQIFDRLYLLLRSLQSAPDESFRVMTRLLNDLSRESVESIMGGLERSVSFDESALKDFAPLTWDMVETMHRSGITIGSHTKSHRLLTSENIETVKRELMQSKEALEARLKTVIHHFAYPDGRFNPAVVEAVNATGYRFAYGICRSRDRARPLLTIPRKVLWERASLNAWGRFSPSIMNCHAHWAFDAKGGCEHNHSEMGFRDVHGTIN